MARANDGVQVRLPGAKRVEEESAEWYGCYRIAENGKGPNDPVFDVAVAVNKIFQRDPKAAGIPKEDASGAVAKFRSPRKTSNMLLAKAGVPRRFGNCSCGTATFGSRCRATTTHRRTNSPGPSRASRS